MNGIRRALVLSTADRYFALIGNFAALTVVSRWLTPGEIGISVLGAAVAAFGLSARELATTNFLIQRKDLSTEDIRSAFTVLLLLSIVIAAILVGSAGFVAQAYDEPALVPYLGLSALCLLVEVIGAPIGALLRREMAFGKVAIINVSGTLVNAGATIGLAVAGFSYMSFVWAWLASATVVASLSVFLWRDKSIFRPSLKTWRGMLSFGGYNGINVLLYRIYDALPYLVLARVLSIDSIGLYSRAVLIAQLPDKVVLGGVGSVLMAAFSGESRNGRDLRSSYLKSVEMITALQWPALVGLAVLAHPIVELVLGHQWLEAVPLVRIMALASLFAFTAELNYPVLVAVGAMRSLVTRGLIAWPVSGLIITVAALFGLQATALAWFVIIPFQAYISVLIVRRHVAISWLDIACVLRRAAILTLCSAAGPLALVLLSGHGFELPLFLAVLAVVAGMVGWTGGLWLTSHPLKQEVERAFASAHHLVTRRAAPKAI